MSMYGTTTKRTRGNLSYSDIEWNIKHTTRIKSLEDSIVKMVEWRENHQEDENYSKSKDLLEYAFDKYNDLINGAPRKEESGFCSFLNEV